MNYRYHSSNLRVDLVANRIEMIGETSPVKPWRIALIDTGADSLTGRRVQIALEALSADRFMVTYGDGVAMVMERAAVDLIGPDQNLPLETAVLEKLSSLGQLSVYRHSSFWQCMDTYREMTLLNDMWASGRAAWKVW